MKIFQILVFVNIKDCMHDVNRIPFLGPTKIVHYREGVILSRVYFTIYTSGQEYE